MYNRREIVSVFEKQIFLAAKSPVLYENIHKFLLLYYSTVWAPAIEVALQPAEQGISTNHLQRQPLQISYLQLCSPWVHKTHSRLARSARNKVNYLQTGTPPFRLPL